jgi:hypothetical protein
MWFQFFCLYGSVSFDRDKVVEILEKKLKNHITHWEHILDFKKKIQIDKDNEKLIVFIGGFVSTRLEHSIYWLEELIKQIRQGNL